MTFVNETYKNPIPPTLTTLLEAVKREVMKNINAVKIGVIQSFDAGGANKTASVTVKVAQQQVTSVKPDGTKTIAEYPLLLKVPVYFPAGGGFTLTFPIANGDECIVLFNDREIDNWMTNGAGLPPTSGRVHDLSDGMALVGLRSNPRALVGISTATTQLRSDDGGTYVEVAGGGIVNVVAPTSINMTAPHINLNASAQVKLTTPETEITGILGVDNVDSVGTPCTINGDIHATGDIVGNGISLHNHIHSGVQAGGGNSGPPVP